jgi:hypothetical protein
VRGNRGGTFTRGVERGVKQSAGLAGQFASALGDATGFGALVDIGDELVEEALVESIANPGEIHGLEDIKSLGDVGTFIAQTLGEQAFNLLLAGSGAGLGAAGLRGYLGKKAIAKGLTDAVVNKAKSRGLRRGAEAGAFSAFFPINTGEILQEQVDAGLDPDFKGSLLLGAASTALEVAGFELVLGQIAKNFSKAEVGHTLKQVLARTGHTTLKGLGAEGGTEAIQEALVITSKKLADPSFSIQEGILGSEGLKRITFAGVSGATVGGILGGAGGVISSTAGGVKANLQNAYMKAGVERATESITEIFLGGSARPETETQDKEEVQGLFDVERARAGVAAAVVSTREAVATFVDSVKAKLPEVDQRAAGVAAEERVTKVEEGLAEEIGSLNMASEELDNEAGFIGDAINRLRLGLERVQAVAEKNAKESEATRIMVEEINQLLAEAKKLSVKERAQKVADLLKKAQEGIAKGAINPGVVAKDRLRVLVNTAERYATAGIRERKKVFKAYDNALKVMSTQVANLRKKLPAIPDVRETETSTTTPTQETETGTTTPTQEILRSLKAVAEGVKPAAFAVGHTLQSLPKAVKTALGRTGLVPKQEDGRVTFTRPGEENIDAVGETFGTPVEQIDPDNAAVVTARDEGGGVIQNEVIERDPVSTREAVQRGRAVAGEGGAVEVRSPDEAVTESVRENLNELALEGVDPEYMINTATAVDEAVLTIFGKSGNNQLVLAEVDEQGVVRDRDGKTIGSYKTKNDALKAAQNNTSQKKLEDIGAIGVHAVEVPGGWVVGGIMPGVRGAGEPIQIKRALERGRTQWVSAGKKPTRYIISGKDRNGTPVWFHLGEITSLGFLRNRGATTTFDKLTNAHMNFVEGMTTLITEYGFSIDFDPKRHGDKVVYGRVPYWKSAKNKDRMYRIRDVAERHGKESAAAELIAFFELADKPTSSITWNEVADYLMDEAIEGELSVDDMGTILFGQGAIDPELFNMLREEQLVGDTHAETLADVELQKGFDRKLKLAEEEEFSKESEVPLRTAPEDFFVNDPTVPFASRTSKDPGQVQNTTTDSKGNTWTVAGKAVNWLVKRLNIKEKIIIFDETSMESVLASLGREVAVRNEKGEVVDTVGGIDTELYRDIAIWMSKKVGGKVLGSINPIFIEQGAPILLFVSKNVGPKNSVKNRGTVLMHELGHLIQYTHLDRLHHKTRRLILDSLPLHAEHKAASTSNEAFANFMAKAALDPSVIDAEVADEGLKKFFKDVLADLKAFYDRLRISLGYTKPFEDFVMALNSHARFQRAGDRTMPIAAVPSNLKTPLARKIFIELRKADAGPFISIADIKGKSRLDTKALDANMEDAAERSQTSIFKNYKDDFDNFVKRLKESPADAVKSLVYTTDGELRTMNLAWLADMFHARPGTESKSLTVFREIQQKAAPFFRQLSIIMPTIPEENRQQIMEALMKVDENGNHIPLNQLPAEVRPHVTAVRAYLARMHNWYTSTGIPLGKRQNYYPLMLDGAAIENNRELFIDLIMEHGEGITRDQAEDFRQQVVVDSDGGLNNGYNREANTTSEFFGPGFASTRHRADSEKSGWTPALRNALVEAGFYQQDLATTLIAYTEMAVRRAVWQKRFGFAEGEISFDAAAAYETAGINPHSPIAKLQMRLYEAHRRGDINSWQYDRVRRDLLPAYAGQLGLRTNYHLRKLSAWMVIYQNLRILGFAVLSSFVDVGTLVARTDISDIKIHGQSFKQFASKQGRAELMEMLEDIGAMRQSLTEHILNDQALNTFMTGRAKRINDLFFRYNGMEGWTNMMRALALAGGRQFLIRHAGKARDGNAKSQRYLAELDIKAEEVLAWDGHSTSDVRINAALNRFIDESMIRPDPSIRPTWMSDPSYGVFAHLKGFMYGFHETFLRRALNEVILHQNLLPFLMLGMMALPFAAIGYELRRHITGSSPQRPEGFDYMQEVVERSGLLGAFQFVVDMEQADEFGKPYALGIAGPSVEQLYDFWTKDMESFVPRSIPIVAQFPQARKWLENEVL